MNMNENRYQIASSSNSSLSRNYTSSPYELQFVPKFLDIYGTICMTAICLLQKQILGPESLNVGLVVFAAVVVVWKEKPRERPIIHSTMHERLSYYRAVTSTSSKVEIIATQQIDMNSFLWFYCFNIFFKSMPHNFVHFFLAEYAPDEHMFVAKMVPFSHGIKYLFVLVGFLELISNMDLNLIILHYFTDGITEKSPWNRCDIGSHFDSQLNVTVNCYEMSEFAKKFLNKTQVTFHQFSYISDENEYFQVAQIEYYRTQVMDMSLVAEIFFFVILWSLMQFVVIYSSTSYFWKILHWCQWSTNFIDFFTFGCIIYYDRRQNPVATLKNKEGVIPHTYWATDIDMLAESITAPPVIHVLTSRSVQEIDPTRDSTIMVISNALTYIFRGILSSKMKAYCERQVNTQIPITQFNHHSWFYFTTMFWNTFYLGNIFCLLYSLLNLMVEFLIIVVTYKCIIEMVIYEWQRIKVWMILIVISGTGLLVFMFTSVDTRKVLWIYGKGLVTLAETIFIYVMYPLGRLVDDYIFHYGQSPTKLRVLSFRIVPVYYLIKLYFMLSSLWYTIKGSDVEQDVSHYQWSWTLMLLPIFLGMLYIVYKYVLRHRAPWTYIFRPLPQWGPRDFTVRQLRKQFDSRYYIRSEVPKFLSRYLMSTRDSKVFKVDVRYDFYRRSTVSPFAVRFGEA